MGDSADSTRVMHLTDMHLRWHQPGSAKQPDRLSREMPAVLERLAARLRDFTPDVMVITGDLLDVPDPVVAQEMDDGGVSLEVALSTANFGRWRKWAGSRKWHQA